ncbi:DNA repair protein XRCC3-like isoform X1 [Neodiprion fabricii]|uniref:DNA repair protein XRCC3-like isoform X1 n=1 Tax=Neodiprion fabricii TaxID=2872261 RepID=UPI001ED92205|nr:DNA repair protein XRCC3-like isoform X1 [Neodiprion fabricii]
MEYEVLELATEEECDSTVSKRSRNFPPSRTANDQLLFGTMCVLNHNTVFELHSVAIKCKTVKCLASEEKFLSLGCPHLDSVLRGGFVNRGITQIYGAAGTGKTQIALQLCLTVQLPIVHGGYEAGAVYISTEGAFPSRRLQELLRESNLTKKFNVTADIIFVTTIHGENTIQELENCIVQKIPHLMATRKIGLLILDSIAAPYRAGYSLNTFGDRAKSLWNIANQLHNLASQYKLTVICINQVSAAISFNNYEVIHPTEQPTLGITWANMITNNFYLCRTGDCRYLYTMQSSYLPRTHIEYRITGSGVSGVCKNK